MIDKATLQEKVEKYRDRCQREHKQPTYIGLAFLIGVSNRTISNVVNGRFNGRCYTDTPCATRCIGNADFEIVQGLYK